MPYAYKVYPKEEKNKKIRYTRQELENMGTFMLRDICVREKIMTRGAGLNPQRMERSALLELVYRYRGRPDESMQDNFPEESILLLEEMLAGIHAGPGKLEVPFKINIKKGIPLLPSEQIQIVHEFEGNAFCGILADPQGHIKAVFEVDGQCLTLSPGRMDGQLEEGLYYDWQFYLFDAASTARIIQAYNEQAWSIQAQRSMAAVKARLPVLEVRKAPAAAGPLFIDFGAVNTCAAAADDAGVMQQVLFGQEQPFCPGCAAVKQCGRGNVLFVYGYEALSLIQKDGFGSSITFIHNIKRFLFEKQSLEVYDAGGNAACIDSDMLLRDYLHFVIRSAEGALGTGFQEIRFLMPEKRGQLALNRIRGVLGDYRVEPAESESLNSVYKEIIDGLEEADAGNRIPVLVIHCGGGSVSLVGCDYEVHSTRVAYEAVLEERYLNGDSGFGGNNLTYLIMQYLKIRLYHKIMNRSGDILGEEFEDAYTLVDESGTTEAVYAKFYQLYEEAEAVIPTRFEQVDEFRRYKKQNYFRLWFLAEQVKIRFASDNAKSTLCLKENWEEYCSVNIFRDGDPEEYPVELELYRDEIWQVAAPEIYRIVKNFLEPYCNEYGILQGYRIKFAGLSCNIPVFRDAVREFTVGRRARLPKGGKTSLKLRAIEGAVKQEELLKSGRLIPEIIRRTEAASYTVAVRAHDGGSIKLMPGEAGTESVMGSVTRHISTREVEFLVQDSAGQAVRKRTVPLDRAGFQETDYERLFREFPILQEVQGDLDSIGGKEIRLFVFSEEGWDFCVLPVSRRDGCLYADKVSRFQFDDNGADFFRGCY